MKNNFDEMISKIKVGNAILFTGAGFSRLSSNSLEEKLPLAADLAKKICSLWKHGESDDLQYVSSRYIKESDQKGLLRLISLLKKTFLVTDPSPEAIKICLAPWNKFYTTNYDNTIEKIITDLHPVDAGEEIAFEICDRRCVHINGYIGNLTESTLNTSFKLSESSYMRPEGFLNSPWYTIFKRDLERASAIIFAGYSLYDIDIKRILVSNADIFNKTYFITMEGISEKDIYMFSQYGKVFPIGLQAFSDLIANSTWDMEIRSEPKFMTKYTVSSQEKVVTDNDIEKLLLKGQLDEEIFQSGIVSKRKDYIVYRDDVNKVVQWIDKKHIVVTSEFCNGKTIFAYQCLVELSQKFKYIYEVNDPYGDNISDLENIILNYSQDEDVIIFIDNYTYYYDFIEYVNSFNNNKIHFLLTSRSGKHERKKQNLDSKGMEYKEICIDRLIDREQDDLSYIIDSIGYWGKDFPTHSEQCRFIKDRCNGQMSVVLFNLLESQHVKNKIYEIISQTIENEKTKSILTASLFLGVNDFPIDTALLSELTGDFIYDNDIINDTGLNDIFQIRQGKFFTKSSIFCQKAISLFIESDYILDSLLTFIGKLQYRKSKISHEIFKSCLKFSTIERLLANEKNEKFEKMTAYYERVKRIVPWLVNDPHFWLQYAMGHIACKKYQKAQQLINQAYGKAIAKVNYYTDNIDTQQARLFILQALSSDCESEAIDFFIRGHNSLRNVPNSRYKYRQVKLYEDFYKEKYLLLTDAGKELFKKSCREIIGSLTSNIQNEEQESSAFFMRNKVVDIVKNLLKLA